jgi:hypothetical protein
MGAGEAGLSPHIVPTTRNLHQLAVSLAPAAVCGLLLTFAITATTEQKGGQYMRVKSLAAIVAASLITASTAAAAQVTTPAPVERASAATPGASQLDDDGGITIWIIGAVVLGLIIWGIIELTEDDDEEPISP